jgi:hypothetical protein
MTSKMKIKETIAATVIILLSLTVTGQERTNKNFHKTINLCYTPNISTGSYQHLNGYTGYSSSIQTDERFISNQDNQPEEKENERFGFELNLGGPSLPTSKLAGDKLKTGFGFEGIFHWSFMPHTGIYAGWGWHKFTADHSFAGDDIDFEETGYIFGLQFKHPIPNSSLKYFVRGGGLYNHIELENESGEIIGDTGHGMGWQVAGGIDLSLGKAWSFIPSVKFNSLSRELDWKGTTRDLHLKYASVRIGFLKKF